MGLKECVITLDNQWNTYYPGQTINGRIDYTFDAPKKFRGIAIMFKGACETKWSETGTRQDAEGKTVNVTDTYTGNEEYFSISYYLLGSKSGNEIEVPAGTHSYPFTCALPPTLPSSFEGEFGFVRYTIKVTLDRPWKFDQDTKMAFTVVSHLDLNSSPEYRQPVEMHFEKSFCCCWCKSGPMILDVGIPVSGYCCGQTIPIQASCENGSDVTIGDVHIALRKIVRFRAQVPRSVTKESHIIIAEMNLGSTGPNTSRNWQEGIEIPPLPPSNLLNCSLIDLDYELKVTCKPSGPHMNLEEKRAIILGTVPINGFQSPPPGSYGQPSVPGQESPPNSEQPLLPPPGNPYPVQPGSTDFNPGAPGKPYPGQPGSTDFNPGAPGNPYPGQPGSTDFNPGAPGNPYPGQPAFTDFNPSAPPPSGPNFPNSPVQPSLYPALSHQPQQPVFREGQFASRSIHDADDHQNMRVMGGSNFAPRYPTYGFSVPQQ